jgi:hypothetical protein
MRWLFSIQVFLFMALALWPVTAVRGNNDDIITDRNQVSTVGYSVTSNLGAVPESANITDIPKFTSGDSAGNNPGGEFSLSGYITPADREIAALAERTGNPQDAYKVAVQWPYVSDEKLNQVTDKWLTPHEFITASPFYATNPLPGEIVGDCEEKANTLVSLIRATGVSPDSVRVVLGKVTFNGIKMGHAWVELLAGGRWLALDTCWGPYWDDQAGELVHRDGVPFNYYADHSYPVVKVWVYYNDVYYMDLRNGSGNAPASWF